MATHRPPYPASARLDTSDLIQGVLVSDPYRWLEDSGAADVKRWSADQDHFARAWLGRQPARKALHARLDELTRTGAVYAPVHYGPYFFYERSDAGKEKRALYIRDVAGRERPLIDPNAWAQEDLLSIQGFWPSPDGTKVAYKVSKNNVDWSTLRVMDVATGSDSTADFIYPVRYGQPSWSADSSGFYYRLFPTDPKIPATDRNGHAEVRFHRLGTPPRSDALVRRATGDPKVTEHLAASLDGRWLFLSVARGYSRTDLLFRDAKAATSSWTPLVEGRDHLYELRSSRSSFYVRTDDGATTGHLFRVDPNHPGREHWQEVVRERPDATLEAFTIANDKLVLQWQKDAVSELEIRDLDGTGSHRVNLPTLGNVSALNGHPDDRDVYVSFTSYTTPRAVYSIPVETGELREWARVETSADPSKFLVEEVFYDSKDGTRVPMFIVHRKDVKVGDKAPTLLTAYGGFASSMSPWFVPGFYAWIERGGVFAEAGVRGGAEYGEEWHRVGMLTRKQNSMDDFIAAAEALTRLGWTRRGELAIRGDSNGGLLTAAAMTQRPDLFRAAICGVPLTDMVRSHLFGNGKIWETEFGSPSDPEQFRALFAYSPYHHVRPNTRYPSVLVLSADSDDRVDPMHARKFVAALQNASTGAPVLLRIEQNAGHLGADSVSASVEADADAYTFALSELGAR